MVHIIFYDFEVFSKYWCVCIVNLITNERKIIDTREELTRYYEENINQVWIGYNSRNYDQYILKGVLAGIKSKFINDEIIINNKKGWEISSVFNTILLNNYDVFKTNDRGLKFLEASMGNSIKESDVPFDKPDEFDFNDLKDTWDYCMYDAEQTVEVFIKRIDDFNAHLDILKTFKLPLLHISKTQAQLSALALDCVRKKWDDEWDIQLIDTLRIDKYWHIMEWFKNPINHNMNSSLTVNLAGVPHQFGWGGLHGAPDKPVHRKGLIIHVDVGSFYPTIMIEYDLLTRNARDKNKFKEIYDRRMQLKAEGKKKEQAPYKIILNSTYGISNDPYSSAYDPRQAHNVCANGQLLLLDLIEHLEDIPSMELIQSNTDGLIIQIDEEHFEQLDDICYEWETRTRMSLEFDFIKEIYQKDVNNYLFIREDDSVERIGAYVKPLDDLDYDLPIVNKALVDYFVKKIPVEQTILNCNELKEFQIIRKISYKYDHIKHGETILKEKTIRCFASVDSNDLGVSKKHATTGTYEKIEGTPVNCFIYNDAVNGLPVPKKLDKGWYIELAKKRLEDYGIVGGLFNEFI